MTVERWTIVFTGRVQGVFFRATTHAIAGEHGVAGWVRNEPDGSVRCVAEADVGTLTGFLDAVEAAKRGNIERVDVTKEPARGDLAGFTIRR